MVKEISYFKNYNSHLMQKKIFWGEDIKAIIFCNTNTI